MEATPSLAMPMLQLGLLMAGVLVGNSLAARRLPVEVVPGILENRILLCNRLRPWLSAAALLMIVSGLAILLS